MQSRKSLLAKIFGVLCALCCVVALAFGVAACDSNTDTTKSVVNVSVVDGQLVIDYSDGSKEEIDLGDLKGEQGEQGEQGPAGVGITSVTWDETKQCLVITYTDGKKQEVKVEGLGCECPEPCEHENISTWVLSESYEYNAATDTYKGTLLEVCDDCGYAWLTTDAEHQQHVWKDVAAVEPTCCTDGHEAGQECEICGKFQGGEVKPATGNHVWDEGHLVYSENENVCEQGGVYIYLCTTPGCDAYRTEDNILGHTVTSLEVLAGNEPTATKEGKAQGTCTECGETVYVTLPKLTSDNIKYEVVDGENVLVNEDGVYTHVAPTCTAEGSYTITIEPGTVLTIDAVVVKGEVQLTYKGEKAFTDEFADEAVGHTVTTADGTKYIVTVTEYDNVTQTVTVNIKNENGVQIFEGDTITSDSPIAELLNFFVNVPESCVDNDKGFQAFIECDVCHSDMLVFYQVAHQFVTDENGDIIYTTEPTCTADGTALCKVCGKVRPVPNTQIEHQVTTDEDGNIVYIEGKEPTCTKNGYSYCKYGCETELEVKDSALGHDIVLVGTPSIDKEKDIFSLTFYCSRGDLGSKESPITISDSYSKLVESGVIVIHEGSPEAPTCNAENPFVIDINGYEYKANDGTTSVINEKDITIMVGHIWDPASGLGYINEDYDGHIYDLDQVEDYIGKFVNVPPANCKESAYAFVYCYECNSPILISVKGTHQNTEVYAEATHSSPAIMHCKDCEAYFYSGSPIAHTLELVSIDKLPTETTAGSATYKCTGCDAQLTVAIPALGSDDWTELKVDKVAATCEENGKNVITGKFDFTYQLTIAANAELGLDELKPSVTVTIDFSNADDKESSVIPATGHTEYVPGKTLVYSWTYTEDANGSLYVGYICQGCGNMIVLWSELEGTECPYTVDVALKSLEDLTKPVDPDQPGEGEEGGDTPVVPAVPEDVTISMEGVVISTSATASTAVTMEGGKTPEDKQDNYYIWNATEVTLVTIGGDKKWKQDTGYIQADGPGRTISVDLSDYEGMKVKVTFNCGSKQEGIQLQVAGDASTAQDVTFNADKQYAPVDVSFTVDGGSIASFENTNQAVRFYSITITVVE